MKRRVVVTGLGVVTALGCEVEELWTRICNGESGVQRTTLFDASQHRCQISGEVRDWSIGGYVAARDVKKLDRFTQFGLVASVNSVRDAGLEFDREDPARCGAILGSGIGGLCEIEFQHSRLLDKGPQKVSAFTIPKLMSNAAAAQVSIRYGLQGPSAAVCTACASASNAISDAMKTIQYGDADVMISGGTEAAITPMGIGAFAAMRALSERNDEPELASRPFDKGRDGFVMAEGAGVLVLEELQHAKNRGARIYAELLGCGITADGSHITQPDKNGTGGAKAMAQALVQARIDPSEITYINAHGTSTPLGDFAETNAIKSIFREHARELSISSTKSQLGHLLGASGGVELVLTILALRRGVIPPTINYDVPDADCDLDYTPNQPREREVKAALSNSFGFGGHNASLIVGPLRNGKS
jgi:3-oxoacyl-[acyl-carrier-protein] synthase II